MASTPSSPITPSRRRRSLRLSISNSPTDAYRSSYGSGMTDAIAFSSKSSRTSHTSYQQSSPTTPRPMSSKSSRRSSYQHRRKSSSRLSVGSYMDLAEASGGLGNLADELENALEDDYEAEEYGVIGGDMDTEQPIVALSNPLRSHNLEQDSEQHIPARSPLQLSPPNPAVGRRKSRHQRTESRYDGSDYGPESGEDEEGLSPILRKRIRDIENVTRMSLNTEETLSEDGGVIARTIHALQDLSPQTNIENNLSRIITAYTSMATHRTHKTRDLFNQAHSLLYSNSILDMTEETRALLLQSLDLLLSSITTFPTPSTSHHQSPLHSLQILHSLTHDLTAHLRTLTDHISESRMLFTSASRRLKTVRDMVDDLNVEADLVETSVLLIQAGDWDRRCRERQAARTCREVVRGFAELWGIEAEERGWVIT